MGCPSTVECGGLGIFGFLKKVETFFHYLPFLSLEFKTNANILIDHKEFPLCQKKDIGLGNLKET